MTSALTTTAAGSIGLAPGPPRTRLNSLLPGIAVSLLLALVAERLGTLEWIQARGLSALTIAIVLGIALANLLPRRLDEAFSAATHDGILISKQTLLRFGVVLYGLRLTFQDVADIGASGVILDLCVIGSTFGLACWLGSKLGLERRTSMLIGIGSAICGAAAIMAAEPVVRARAEEVTIAVATVVVFGTVAIFVYPLLFDLNQQWQIFPADGKAFGMFAGSTIHEVAQVIAAARSISAEAANTAVITKMVRVMLLAPFLMALSAWLAREARLCATRLTGEARSCTPEKVAVPWFAAGFIGIVLLSSTHLVSAPLVHVANAIDTVILATAMAALGLSTRVSMLRRAGLRPLVLAVALAAWLVIGGALLNRWIPLI